jgi:protein SCO1/2
MMAAPRALARLALPWLVCAWFLGGCAREAAPVFHATDITGLPYVTELRVADHTGKPRALEDFRGKVVALFFGYTHCPDVCPTSLADLAAAMRLMGKDAERVQVLFMSVDPERDTSELLAQYVPSFNPGFLGLRADAATTARIADNYHVYYRKQAGATALGYTVDHSAGIYLFDPSGRLRLYASFGMGADKLAHDMQLLFRP